MTFFADCAGLRGITNDDVSSIGLECRTCPAERSSLTPPFYAAAVIKSVSLAPVLQSVLPVGGVFLSRDVATHRVLRVASFL